MKSGRWYPTPFLIAAVLLVGAVHAGAYPRPGTTRGLVSSRLEQLVGVEAAAISPSGRYVGFVSVDPTIVIPDLNKGLDAYVYELKSNAIERVSISSSGQQGIALTDCRPVAPVMSRSGRYVAFESTATNLVPDDDNGVADVFVHDRHKRSTIRVSVSSRGEEQNSAYCDGNPAWQNLSISDNGRFVSFMSPASNLTSGDTNGQADVFVHDLKKRRTERVSAVADESDPLGVGFASCGALNNTGRFVAFWKGQIYFHDRLKDKTEIVSLAPERPSPLPPELDATPDGGGLECGEAPTIAISATGRFVAFASLGDELVPKDDPPLGTIADIDVFVRDRRTGRVERVNVTSNGAEAYKSLSHGVSISDNGRWVAFDSHATNFHPSDGDDENKIPIAFGDPDIYVHDRLATTTNLISIAPDGTDGTCRPELPIEQDPLDGFSDHGSALQASISSNGRFVSFVSCDINLLGDRGPIQSTLDGLTAHGFVRDIGPQIGVGTLNIGASGSDEAPWVYAVARDELGDGGLSSATDLFGTSLVRRDALNDLFFKVEVDRMPHFAPATTSTASPLHAGIIYGVRFSLGDEDYEVRAASAGNMAAPLQPAFGLFSCESSGCRQVAQLDGGYGTTGDSVVVSVPLEALPDDADIDRFSAFTAFGTYVSGALQVLDTVEVRSSTSQK